MNISKYFVTRLLLSIIILTSITVCVPPKSTAASYMIAGRIEPGSLPPYFWAPIPQLDIKLNLNYAGSTNHWQTFDFAKPIKWEGKGQESSTINVDIGWKGFSSKDRIKAGEKIEMTVKVEGGNAPYDVSIDFGDGSKKQLVLDSQEQADAVYVYKSPGALTIRVIVSDSFGKARVIEKKVVVE